MIIYPTNSVLFNFLGFDIHYYSICIFLAIFASLLTLIYLSSKKVVFVDNNVIFDFTPLLILVSIIGARAYYVLLSADYFISNPLMIPMIWNGGISIHGAIIAGSLFGFYYFKKKKLDVLKYFDAFSIVLPLGQAIGRFGNYFNQEAFGLPVSSNFPIKLFVDVQNRPKCCVDNEFFHPTFLYEAFFDFLIFIFLVCFKKKTANYSDGLIFFLYILLYSLIRIFIEFLRLDTIFYLFNIPFPVFVSLFGIVIGLFGTLFVTRKTNV